MKQKEKIYRFPVLSEKNSNPLLLLIAACLILFLGLAFLKAVWHFNYPEKELAVQLYNKQVLALFSFHADPSQLLHRPWTLITGIFLFEDNSAWLLFPSLFWLWSFGFILRDLTGGKKIIPIFIYGGLGGMLAYSLVHAFSPSLQEGAMMGAASCAVMGVAVVTSLLSPGYRIFPMIAGGIPLWVLTLFYFFSVFAAIPLSDTAKLASHAAAAATGGLFIFFFRRGYDWSEWMIRFAEWINHLFQPVRRNQTREESGFLTAAGRQESQHHIITQGTIDALLEKIHVQGYSSLTDEEKELLQMASREEIQPD